MNTPVSTRRFRRRVVIAAIALVLAGTLVITEVLMHLFFYIHYHESADWIPDGHIRGRLKPRQTYMTGPAYNPNLDYRSTSFPVRINKYGFRGPDWSPQPATGTLRIALLGASAAFNYHDREEDTWAQILGGCMSERLGVRTEIVNLAVLGFDAQDSKINYLINGRFFSPHVVIVYHTWNDLKRFRLFEGDPSLLLFSSVAQPPLGPVKKFLAHFQLIRLLRKVYYRIFTRAIENNYRHLESSEVVETRPAVDAAFAWYRRNFEDLVEFVNDDRAIPVLVSQATVVNELILGDPHTRKQVSLELVGMTLPVLIGTWKRANEILEDVARQKQTIFVNGYDGIPHSLEYLEDHVHLAPRGNRALAGLVCGELSRNQRLLITVANLKERGR